MPAAAASDCRSHRIVHTPMTSDTTKRTLRHYEAHAESFWEGTRDHDVSQNIDAFLSAITEPPPFRILELGCGPGRDLKTFAARGHEPIGLDGCARFVDLPRVLSELRETLKVGGVLFFSNPRGENNEGWSGDRYGCYFDAERWRALLT